MKYLTESNLDQALSSGRPVEQWLGASKQGEDKIIKWVRIDREPTGEYSVTLFEANDEGDDSHLDVYEFSPVDAELPYGLIKSFPDQNAALAYAMDELGANADHFVNAGLVQEEYHSFLRSNQ
jgi:hypothetical protein